MREQWLLRPYAARIQLAGALLVSIITLVDIIVFYIVTRRFDPSLGLSLAVATLSIVVFALGAGAIQGYRAVRQAQSILEAGDSHAELAVVSRQFFLIVAMSGLGCVAIIVSINFMIELLHTR